MTLRVACLGAGYFANFHHESWQRMDRADLVGVADLVPELARKAGCPAFGDLSEMLKQTCPDILDIVIPPHGHARAIETALDHRVRAIVCQKPFCLGLDEASRVTRLAAAAGIPLIVHENFRFQPWYREIAMAISAGRIGTVHQATFRLRPGDGQGPAAYLDRQPYFQEMERFLIHETAVHWIDTFRYLFGDPIAVYADLRQLNPAIAGEDAGHVVFEHVGNVRALFDGNRHLDHASDNHRRTMGEALIEGTGGAISLSGDGSVALRPFGGMQVHALLPPDTSPGFGGDCVHRLNLHVVEGLLDGGSFENLAVDYMTVIRTEDAVYRSAQERRRIDVSV